MSPRRRSNDKVVPISIGIPTSLMMRLNNELTYTQSRSAWVQGAIKAKLDDDYDYTSIPTTNLLGMLHYREIISTELLQTLLEKC